MTRPTWTVLAAACVAGLAIAATAFATAQPVLLYDPPRMTFRDLPDIDSTESVQVAKQAQDFTITSQPSGMTVDPDSQDGCDPIAGGYACPVAGVERIVVKLGELVDSGQINLGSRARTVRQTLRGGEGGDDLNGGPGKQRLMGGEGGDEISGGRGDDFIDGGSGSDTCKGGPGEDVVRHCE
jgi:RTX calcium-binding nonapeptide repeat (4 copies)